MNVNDIQWLFDYNYWANQLILDHASRLTAEQLTTPTGFPWGNIKDTLIHVLDAEKLWRHLCQHNHLVQQRLNETEAFPTLASLIDRWKAEEQEMRAYLNSLEDGQLASIVRYEVEEGVRERVLWHCLVHVVNHGTQHRSECAQMLTSMGHSPGSIDMTLYLNKRAGIE